MTQSRRLFQLAGTNGGIRLLAYLIMTVIGVDVIAVSNWVVGGVAIRGR